MAFHQYGKTVKFPRNEHVEIHVRTVTLGHHEYVEIREFIKNGEIYGHGVVLPVNQIKDLKVALERVAP